MASRVALLLAMCVLPAMVAAIRPQKNPLSVQGRVFCDNCRVGFETPATTYIAGAEVLVECMDRNTMEVKFTQKGWTDPSGTFKIFVNEDQEDRICNAKLVSSPESGCSKETVPGREQAHLALTRNNGMASDERFANAMGFMKDEAVSGCDEILRQYQQYDDED